MGKPSEAKPRSQLKPSPAEPNIAHAAVSGVVNGGKLGNEGRASGRHT